MAAPACSGSQSAVPQVRGITATVGGVRLQPGLDKASKQDRHTIDAPEKADLLVSSFPRECVCPVIIRLLSMLVSPFLSFNQVAKIVQQVSSPQRMVHLSYAIDGPVTAAHPQKCGLSRHYKAHVDY